MIRFFKINDPYRLIFIFIIVLVVRIPFWVTVDWMTILQLKWFLIGEKLSYSSHLYKDLYEYISPLSGGTFWIIESISGRSLITVQILGLLLTYIQITVISFSFNERNVYEEKNYIPGLIYGLLSCLFFDFYFISPILLSTTFLVFALNNVLRQIEFRAKRDERILSTGIFLGLAGLFYIPSLLFVIVVLVIYYLFTSTVSRRFLLMIYGWLLPLIIALVYYYIHDSSNELLAVLVSTKYYSRTFYTPLLYVLVLSIVPLFFIILGLIISFLRSRFTNYQSRVFQAMLVFFVGSILVVSLSPEISPAILLIMLPSSCYLVGLGFSYFRRNRLAEIRIWVFIISLLSLNYISIYASDTYLNVYKEYLVQDEPRLEGKPEGKVLSLNMDYNIYSHRSSATRYLNWEISRSEWDQMDSPLVLMEILDQLDKDPPSIIVESSERHFSRLRERVPEIKAEYFRRGDLYIRN